MFTEIHIKLIIVVYILFLNLIDNNYCERIMQLKLTTILTTLLIFSICIQSYANQSPIDSYLGKSSVVIIGDTGFDMQSTSFIKNSIEEYVNSKGCIKVGLEISTDQQEALDKALKGELKFNQLKFNPYIDKDSYINLLLGLRKLNGEGKCLKVFAIDKPDTSPVEKNAWMSAQVEKVVGADPLLVLSSNLQAIKNVEWLNSENNTRFLAERIRRKEIKTTSIMQYWTKGECSDGRVSKFLLARGPRAADYVNDILNSIDAKESSLPSEVTDMIIVWKCPGDSGQVIDKSADNNIKIPEGPIVITDTIEDTDLKLDDIILSDLKKDIKNEKLRIGMSKDHVLLSKGKPSKAIKRTDLGQNVQQWIYECSDDWGFDYECITVTFNGNQVIKIFDIE